MKNMDRAATMFTGIVALLAPAGPAGAQIVLSQPSFEAGQNYAAFFKVEKGCEGSPTTALSVQIPDGVIVLDTPSKPGWTVSSSRGKGQVSEVTWRGKLAAKDADQFGLGLGVGVPTGPACAVSGWSVGNIVALGHSVALGVAVTA